MLVLATFSRKYVHPSLQPRPESESQQFVPIELAQIQEKDFMGSSQLGSALICTRFQAEYRVEDYPGTPPPSVYQVTHGTALQAAECYVQQRVLWRTALQAAECYVRQRVS